MTDPHRTSDGYVRADHLRRGAIDQRGWGSDGYWHIVRLQLRRNQPELWEVEHRVIPSPKPPGFRPPASENSELFNTLTEARRHMKALLKEPPTSYPSPEVA